MNDRALVIVADQTWQEDQVRATGEAVTQAWQRGICPVVTILSLDDALQSGVMKNASVVWLLSDRVHANREYELIGQCQEQRIPVLLTCRNDRDAQMLAAESGVACSEPTASPQQHAAVLQGLWSQISVLHEMAAEMKMLRAQQGGLAGQINRIDEELRLASQLQREFMPRELPKASGVEFRVLWRPAGYVSGDIYDVIRLDENHVGLFVADAVGHGVPAALMTMFIKRSLHTKVIDPKLPKGYRLIEPYEALAQLNRDMVEQQSGQVRFATASYIVVNHRTYKARVARAGHPFPIILRADGSTEQIEPEGGLLGVFPEEEFEQVEVQLQPNDRLLLYSDGFEVAFPSEDANSDGRTRIANTRYTEEFEKLRDGSLEESLHRLEARLDEQSGSLNQRDDLTVMCLAVTPEEMETDEAGPPPGIADRRSRPRVAG